MSTTLDPNATNTVECTSCGWKRVLDSGRFYRGGHTHVPNMVECNEMLVYSEVSPQPPEVYLLGESEAYASLEGGPTQVQVDALAAIYELEGDDVDTALAAAAAP